MKDNGSAQDCRHKENYIGRQTRVTRETQLEPLKQWLSNKMGGDRQSTWEHMASNKQQAMCSTDRDIWWPAWANQQDRDTHTHTHTYIYIYIYIHTHTHTHTHTYIYIYIYTHTHTHTHIYIYIYSRAVKTSKLNRNYSSNSTWQH